MHRSIEASVFRLPSSPSLRFLSVLYVMTSSRSHPRSARLRLAAMVSRRERGQPLKARPPRAKGAEGTSPATKRRVNPSTFSCPRSEKSGKCLRLLGKWRPVNLPSNSQRVYRRRRKLKAMKEWRVFSNDSNNPGAFFTADPARAELRYECL